MPINLGGGSASAIMLGTQTVSKMYLGATEVYPNAPDIFRLTLTGLPIGVNADYAFTLPNGGTIYADHGDGLFQPHAFPAGFHSTISVTSLGSTVIYKSSDIVDVVITSTFNEATGVVLDIGATVKTLSSAFRDNSFIETIDVQTAVNATSYFAMCFNLDNTSSITSVLLPNPAVTVIDFRGMFQQAGSLVCINRINTYSGSSITDMFTGATSLTNPNASEQSAILAGSNYVNANACP